MLSLDQALLSGLSDPTLGLAVSGGGDSVALLCLAQAWAVAEGRKLEVVTVDHGLRAGAAADAALVADLARSRGLAHSTLNWDGPAASGNLQEAAREARFALIGAWAEARGIRTVLTGHTLDDQAETVLMRLARGSGVDGLSGIPAHVQRAGVRWLRPLLHLRRDSLRAWLKAQGVAWAEDPSNDDPRFDRARLRAARETLAGLGLTAERLGATASSMQRARGALEVQTRALAEAAATPADIGAVTLRLDPLLAAPQEVRLRLLAHALGWVSGAVYRPRLAALAGLEAALLSQDNGTRTLQGCVIQWRNKAAVLVRELAQTGPEVPAGALWDGRWQTSSAMPGLSVSALGERGVLQIPDWRASGHFRLSLLASPAFWQNDAVVAAPFAMPREGCHAALRRGLTAFFDIGGPR